MSDLVADARDRALDAAESLKAYVAREEGEEVFARGAGGPRFEAWAAIDTAVRGTSRLQLEKAMHEAWRVASQEEMAAFVALAELME